MCGIIGIISRQKDACHENNLVSHILKGLYMLRNRGYDSCGAGILSNDKNFIIRKFGSTVDNSNALELLTHAFKTEKIDNTCNIGIGHNRWATHGSKTDVNAHPHVSADGQFMLVHNGIIENYNDLKLWLADTHGYKFKSQTDSEVIVALISIFFRDGSNKGDVIGSIQTTINMLVGTYGIVIVNREQPNKIYCVRNGSPLLVGKSDDFCIITSEQSGFHNQVNTYITLEKNDICTISTNEVNEIRVETNCEYNANKVVMTTRLSSPAPYDHWTLREIKEQPETVLNALNNGGRLYNDRMVKLGGLDLCRDALVDINNVILLGCGSSYYSAQMGGHFIKLLCSFDTVQVIDGADLVYYDIPHKGKTAFVLVSQSGETKDLHRCIEIAHQHNIVTIGVVNVVDSLIAREVDCGVYCNTGVEVGVASTKSFSSQVVCLSLVAIWFSQNQDANVQGRISMINSLHNLSNDVTETISVIEEQVKVIAKKFAKSNNMFLLGKSCDAFIAHEAALKFKEITYIHAEGASSSSLKHGPFALLDKNFPVILLNCQEEHTLKTSNCYQEIITRGAPVLMVTNKLCELSSDFAISCSNIVVKTNNHFGGLLALLPLQLIAYYVALEKGINPDTPKNLAKVVTVE